MIKISSRARKTPFSPIRKLSCFANKAERRGIKIYQLNIGQPDLETPPIFFKKIKGFSEKTLSYAPSEGYEKVREAWRKYYNNYGIDFKADEILVTTGGSEAILFSFLATGDPNDEIVVFEPIYPNYITFAHMASVKLVAVTLKIDNFFHLPAKEEIVKKLSNRTKAILICNPNNPTGAVYARAELQMIVDIAKKYNLFIIADEAYREFVFDHKKHFSLMNFPSIRNQLILIDSASKRFNICGARIGCLASKNKEVMQSALKFAQGRLSSPTLEQLAVIPLLENSRKYTKLILRELTKSRNTIINKLCKITGVSCFKPEGGFYYITTLPVKNTEKFCRWLLEKFQFNGKTVLLAPGSGFYLTKRLGEHEVRIAFVLDQAGTERAIDILRRALIIYNK